LVLTEHIAHLILAVLVVDIVNCGKLTDFAAISLPKLAGNPIYMYFDTVEIVYK